MMNAFGTRRLRTRRIFVLVFFCAGAAIGAEELKSAAIDLIYQSLDLKYTVEDLGGGAEQLKGRDESATGSSGALKSQIVDLVAKGVEVKETATEVKINLLGDILFDFDKADVRAVAEPTLAKVAQMIRAYSKATVVIDGYTDAKGSEAHNAKLSERRALSVKNWFAKHGVVAASIQAHGWGAARPVAPNVKPDGSDDPNGRQKNRRVEITIKK
jgi:outer membrane protein OmpA-like peptidoglycan-associated protein